MWRSVQVVCVLGALVLLASCSSPSATLAPPAQNRTSVAFAVMRLDLLTASGMPNGSFAYVYSDSLELKREDSIGQAADYSTFEYDPTGAVVVREKHYKPSDLYDGQIEYSYDANNALQEAVAYDANDVMLWFETYQFSQGKKQTASLHDASGVEHDLTFSYDAAGYRIGSLETVAGTMTASSRWHYANDGAPLSVDLFGADGSTPASGRQLTTVNSGANYDYFAFWDF